MGTIEKNGIPDYKILNTQDVRDIPYRNAEQHQSELDLHWEEQQTLVQKYVEKKDTYIGHFFKKDGTDLVIEDEIQVLLQYLALKEGANFVCFKDGKYGFVGYYGLRETGFWLE